MMLSLLTIVLYFAGGQSAFFLSPVRFGSRHEGQTMSLPEIHFRQITTAGDTPVPSSQLSGDCISKSILLNGDLLQVASRDRESISFE
jgi:hypothetical protein